MVIHLLDALILTAHKRSADAMPALLDFAQC